MSLFLAALFLLQGIPVGAGQGGTVSGVLRGTDGKPLAYVRVVALAPAETIDAAMSGLAETDEQGRYSIEGIPQGRYYIAAGRVDFPTYYPGTLEMTGGTILSVKPGSTISGIDFVMDGTSTRVPQGEGLLSPVSVKPPIPVQVTVAGGGRIPIFSNGRFPILRFDNGSSLNSVVVPVNATSANLQSQSEFDVQVENLPEGYVVQSMTYGSTDLQTARLKVPAVILNANTGRLVTVNQGRSVPFVPPATVAIVLRAPAHPTSTSGVEVSGRVRNSSVRSVYLSGVPGTLYADRSFEFHGVPPGKHVLAGLDSASPLGALVVVGDRDMTGIELRDEVSPVPFDIRSPRAPEPLDAAVPGTLIPLPSVRGTLRDQVTQKPIADVELKITGYSKTETFSVDANGRFEIPHLFPGSYKVEVGIFGHEQVLHNLTVGTENITLELTTRRLY